MRTLFFYADAAVVQPILFSDLASTSIAHYQKTSVCPVVRSYLSLALTNMEDPGGNTGPYDDDGEPD
jgi:hypothetical protein